ncbi:MAG: pseudouridine synthase [Burkholderiales bacterium]|nr:MAG: pseudouridine synthase [Burkholderiales bacterium]
MNDAADQDQPLPNAADAEAPAAPKRRRTTKAAAADAAPEAAAPAEAPVPVKRTRRKADAAAEAPADVAPAEPAAAEAAPAPARKRAPRKTAAAETPSVESVAAPAPTAEPEPAPAPAPTFSAAPAVAPAGEVDNGDGEGADEGGDGEDGERGGRSRNRRRNRKERAERQAAQAAAGGESSSGIVLAPELVEAAGARFADVLSGTLDAESEAADAAPPVLAPQAADEAADGGEAAEGDAKRVLAPDADAPKLQKVLAQSGIGSRRDIEEWIAEGKIEVNGEVAHVGQRISFGDKVRVNGKEVRVRISPPNPRILAYHKPTGEVSTFNDPEGRPTVFRTLPRVQGQKWQSVGRLDINTEGLLLFTNSGELANQLMHPRFGVEREYAARVLGSLSDEQRSKLLEGVNVEGQTASFKSIEDGGGEGANRWYRVVITEGRNREVRKLFEAVGMVVSRLIRIRYGTVVLPRGLKRGVWVELGDDDVRVIRRLAGHVPGGQGQGQQQAKGQQQQQGGKNDRNKRRSDDRHSGVGPRPSRPPEPQQPRPPREERVRRDDDEDDDDFIPHHVNPLEQTFDRRHATGGKRGIPQGFGAGGSGHHGGGKPGKGGNKGGGPREPDPMQTSVGYIGGDAFLRRGGGGGRGGKGGGGRSGGGFGGRNR